MGDIYSLAVKISLDSTAFSTGASAVMRLFSSIQHAAGVTGAQIDRLGKSLALVTAGAALTGVGVLLADGLGRAAKKGAELQTVMAGIGLATGASHAQMRALESSFVSIGLKNQMSKIDVATLGLASTHAGITDIKQLQASIGTIANFAEVQQLSTHVSRDSAATTGVEYAHIFGAYTPQLLNPLINVLSKALTHTPLTGAAFEALVSQFGGMTASLYGRSTPDQLKAQRDDTMMGVLLGQMGQGSRGGTQFGSGLINLATAKPNTAAWRAEHTLEKAGGGHFFNQDGSFRGVRNLLEIINHAANVLSPGAMTTINKAAFGKVGMKVFGNLEQNARLQQWDVNATTFARIPGIDKQQAVYNATAEGQSQQWHKNIETAVTLFGTALLPTLVKVSQVLVGITHNMVDFMNTHQGIVKFAAGFSLVAAGAALVVGPVLMAAGAFGILSAAGLTLDLAFVPFTAIVLGIVAAVAAVTLVITHWSDIMAWASKHASLLRNIVLGLAIIFPPLGIVIGVAVLAFQHWGDIMRVVQTILSAFGTFLRPFAAVFGPLLQAIGLLAGGLWTVLNTTDMLKSSLSSLSAPFVVLGTDINTAHKALDALLAKLPHGGASGGKGGTPLLQGFVHALVPVLPGGTILNPFLTGLGVGGGGYVPHAPSTGSAYDMPPIQRRTQPVWDMPPIQRRGAQGAAPVYHLHIAPGAVGPIHVHGADHHDEEALAKRVGAHVVRDLGDELVHTLTSGAPSVFGLSPILNVPAPR